MKVTTKRLHNDRAVDLESFAGSTGMLFAQGDHGLATRGVAAVIKRIKQSL